MTEKLQMPISRKVGASTALWDNFPSQVLDSVRLVLLEKNESTRRAWPASPVNTANFLMDHLPVKIVLLDSTKRSWENHFASHVFL